MKPVIVAVIFICIFVYNSQAQAINWGGAKKEERHMVHASIGAEHGLIYGVGYGYKLGTGLPIVLNAAYSFPSGKNLLDDFKTRIGGQVRLLKVQDFHLSTNIYGVFRRFENDYATIVNFGGDMSAAIGYYQPRWFVAGEAGFDKAISTHFKHSKEFKKSFPDVKDGWYEPATGGNFYYDLQGGISFKQHDVYLKAGKIIAQDLKTNPLIPFYLQLGYNFRW